MSAKQWMYTGCAIIAISNILQIIGFYPSLATLSLAGIVINTISVPLTIIQARKSAIESQQQLDQERTERQSEDTRIWLDSQPGYVQASFQDSLRNMQQELEQQGKKD